MGGCIGIVGFYSNQSTVSTYDMIAKESSPRLILLSKVSEHANRAQVEAIGYVLLGILSSRFGDESVLGSSEESTEELEEMKEALVELNQALDSLKVTQCLNCIENQGKQSYEKIRKASGTLISLCNKLVLGVDKKMSREALLVFKEEIEIAEEVLLELLALETSREHQMLDKRMNEATEKVESANVLIFSITAGAIFMAAVLGWLLSGSIIRPLNNLKSFAKAVGDGNLDQRINSESKDEIGSLAYSFQQMAISLKQNLEEKVRLQRLSSEAEKEKIRVEELEKINRELEQFAYVSSHDLKSPLVNMAGIIQMMEMNGGINSDNALLLEKLKTSVSNMRHKITKLNEVIKYKKNLKIEPEEVSFLAMTQEVMRDLDTQIKESGVVVNTDFRSCEVVRFPAVHLHHVLLNLMSNSIKYKRPEVPAIVNISSSIEEEQVALVFSDNGLGIDLRSYGSKLFGLFKRFHLSVEGDGIGLHTVKNIIEGYGGRIEVESEPNLGTTFTIYFAQTV